MKASMSKLFKIIVIILSLSVTSVYADQTQPYIKIGGEELVENGISEGHKAFALVGVKLLDESKIEKEYSLETWSMIEAVDEDPEMLKQGFRAGIELKRAFFNLPIKPYFGLNFEGWSRERNEKYINSFRKLNFIDIDFGSETVYKFLYMKTGLIYPFWSETENNYHPKGRLSPCIEVGFKIKKSRISYSYKRISFSGDGPQKDLEVNTSTIRISYDF